MQVARMLEPSDRSYKNKIKEIFRAFQLELHFSKDEILNLYSDLLDLENEFYKIYKIKKSVVNKKKIKIFGIIIILVVLLIIIIKLGRK